MTNSAAVQVGNNDGTVRGRPTHNYCNSRRRVLRLNIATAQLDASPSVRLIPLRLIRRAALFGCCLDGVSSRVYRGEAGESPPCAGEDLAACVGA